MRLEKSIETEVLKYLKGRKKSFTFKHPPIPTGFPDVFHLEKGTLWLFELKRTKKHKPTKIQKYVHKKLRKAGAKVYVVWSLDQVKELIH
jgi:Holliday junction resolvase